MREICTSGTVGGEGGNILAYPAASSQTRPPRSLSRRARLCTRTAQCAALIAPYATGEFPVPAKQIPCSVQKQGIVRSALESQRKWAPEPDGKRRDGRKFQQFPVLRESRSVKCAR